MKNYILFSFLFFFSTTLLNSQEVIINQNDFDINVNNILNVQPPFRIKNNNVLPATIDANSSGIFQIEYTQLQSQKIDSIDIIIGINNPCELDKEIKIVGNTINNSFIRTIYPDTIKTSPGQIYNVPVEVSTAGIIGNNSYDRFIFNLYLDNKKADLLEVKPEKSFIKDINMTGLNNFEVIMNNEEIVDGNWFTLSVGTFLAEGPFTRIYTTNITSESAVVNDWETNTGILHSDICLLNKRTKQFLNENILNIVYDNYVPKIIIESNSNSLTKVSIFDINGRENLLFEGVINQGQNKEISLTNLNSGIYFVKIITGAQVKISKVIIND